MNKVKKTIFLLLISGFYVPNLLSGVIGRIGDPELLPGVKHKILILEYDNPIENTWGTDIAQIIAQEMLGSITGVQSFGVINLHKPDSGFEYLPENIIDIAKHQKAAIVIWGEFYKVNNKIYLHSHLKIVPQDSLPESQLKLNYVFYDPEYRSLNPITASPPSLQINFKPIELSINTLNNLKSHYSKTTELRQLRDESLIPIGKLSIGDTYYILEREGDWIKVKPKNKAPGWIKYNTTSFESELKDTRGVIKIAQGMMQYIAGSYQISIKSLNEYLNTYAPNQDAMNKAMGHIVLGNAKLRSTGSRDRLPSDENISIEYKKANELLPFNTAATNYLAIIYLAKYLNHPDRDGDMFDLEKRLIQSISFEKNHESIKSLLAVYRLSLDHDLLKPYGRLKINPRIRQLESLIKN